MANDFYGQDLSNDQIAMLDNWLRDEAGVPFWKLIHDMEAKAITEGLQVDKSDKSEIARIRYHIVRWLLDIPKDIRDMAILNSKK